jgi:hypothetical protein
LKRISGERGLNGVNTLPGCEDKRKRTKVKKKGKSTIYKTYT